MQLALVTTFAASRKEPLVETLERVRAAFLAAGEGEPQVTFMLSDGQIVRVSSIDRVLKRHPELARFDQTIEPFPGGPPMRVLTNRVEAGAGAGEQVDFAVLAEIARGVPKSFPFHVAGIRFALPVFAGGTDLPVYPGDMRPGIIVNDSWWVSGRQRSVLALTIVEAEAAAKKLPAVPAMVAQIFAACGKAKSTTQVPLIPGMPTKPEVDPAATKTANDLRALMQDYKARIAEIVERAGLPHDLPSMQEALATRLIGEGSGPKKPELVRVFGPLGYDCKGGHGTFTLRRRTATNLTVELEIDVGTWSNSCSASLSVDTLSSGVAMSALLRLPVTKRAIEAPQYPIGDAERWRMIVENLGALVAELDRTFVPAVEAIAGPAPEWYQPESKTA